MLLMHEPSQGIDALPRAEISRAFAGLAPGGVPVVVCRADYDFLTHLCTRVMTRFDGRLRKELLGAEITVPPIIVACEPVPA